MAKDKLPSHRLLALVPLLFAAQQVAEGVVWVTFDHPSWGWLRLLSVAIFLAFALVVWPTWVPLALWAAETNPRRRKVLSVLAWVGAGVSVYAGIHLTRGQPTAHVTGHSIAYSYAETGPALVLALYLPTYVIPAVVPFFVSTMRKAKIMGGALTASLLLTFIIERQALTSVWCFFAATLSIVIVLGISGQHRLTIEPA